MPKTKKYQKAPSSAKEPAPGLRVDLDQARELMADAVTLAGSKESQENSDYMTWWAKVNSFSKLVDDVGYRASIALLGSALIAKATNNQINPLSLRAKAQVPGAYNVRGPAEHVLYPASLDHGFDIGSNSRNPLNGQTFNKLESIDLKLTLRDRGQELVKPLLALLHDVSLLKSREEAVRALAAYVDVRRAYKRVYANAVGVGRLQTANHLSMAVAAWVANNSEGGGRAQAAVGGLLDAVYGESLVRVGKVNEPDRKMAGDVCVLRPGQDSIAEKALEVRDKKVTRTDVLSVIQKLARAGMRKGAIVAIGDSQAIIDPAEYDSHATNAGVQLELFYRWHDLIRQAVFWSGKTEMDIVAEAANCIRKRSIMLELRLNALTDWDNLSLDIPMRLEPSDYQ